MTDATGEGKFDPAARQVTLNVETEQGGLEVTGTIAGTDLAGTLDAGGGAFSVSFTAKRTGDAPAASATDPTQAAVRPAGEPLEKLLPGPRWVSSIEASRFRRGRVYITCDGHRSNDDKPYVFASDDYGVTWRSIVSNLPENAGTTHVVREDLQNENVLYLGTEFAIFVSVDRGQSWTKLNSNLPTVAVHEVALHPSAGELVAATHGRSLWILDVAALRQFTPESLAANSFLYRPQAAVKWRSKPSRGSSGTRRFVGQNAPGGATLYYSLGRDAGSVELKITDIEGRELAEIAGENRAGLHRVVWDLRRTVPPPSGSAQAGAPRGGRPRGGRGTVASGQYLVTLTVDDQQLKQVLTVADDPSAPAASNAMEESTDEDSDDEHVDDEQASSDETD